MIIDTFPNRETQIESQNRLPDIIRYSIICFRLNGDILILRNRDNDISKLGNTDFPHLVGEYRNIDFFRNPVENSSLYRRLV